MSPPDRSDKLQKLYFRIGEVASIVGVEPHVLRYWESEFRSVRPQKSARGQRIYSRRDVDTLLKVKELLYSHRFTIAGAKRRLRDGGLEPVAPAAAEPAEAPHAAAAPAGLAVLPAANGQRDHEPSVHASAAVVQYAPAPQVVAARPSVDVTQLRALRDKLITLRERAQKMLQGVDAWAEEAHPAALDELDR